MYRQTLNAFALKSLQKPPSIPDFHLMVGSAEELAPLPLLVYASANIPTEISKNIATMSELSNDDITQKIANNELEVNDLNAGIASLGISGLGGV